MRLKVRTLRQAVKGDLPIEFVPQHLTSYGGLELVRRYVRKRELVVGLRTALAALPSDYGSARLALLVMSLFYVGARRLEQKYLVGDPLVARFCGLARLPSSRTVSNWLKQFTQATLAPLVGTQSRSRRGNPRRLALAAADDRRGWDRRLHRRPGPVGVPRVQSASSETSQLLPVARPRRPDRPHPASQEPPGQRPRLQAGRGLRARVDRPRPRGLGRALPLEFHGCRVFPARHPAPARCPRLRLRHQSRLLELAAPQATGGRAARLGRRWRRA